MNSAIAFAKLKLVRIAAHIEEINGQIEILTRSKNAYEIRAEPSGKETLHFIVGPSAEVQIIAGEIVYQLKSILDQLAFALVSSNPNKVQLEKGWETRCEFPLIQKVPTDPRTGVAYSLPVPQAVFDKRLPGLLPEAYIFIEGVQPYRAGPGVHNILRIVGKLANIDKHRHGYILVQRAAVHNYFTCSDGFRHMSTTGGVNHGTEIPLFEGIPGETPLNVARTITPYITFDETVGAGPDTLDTENVLQVCLDNFRSEILPSFERLIQ